MLSALAGDAKGASPLCTPLLEPAVRFQTSNNSGNPDVRGIYGCVWVRLFAAHWLLSIILIRLHEVPRPLLLNDVQKCWSGAKDIEAQCDAESRGLGQQTALNQARTKITTFGRKSETGRTVSAGSAEGLAPLRHQLEPKALNPTPL